MNWWSIFGDLSNVVATALAAYSIYITIKEQKIIRENEKNKIIIEQNLNWYNEVVIKDIIKKLSLFIDKSEQALDECRTSEKDLIEENLNNAYNCIKDNYRILYASIFVLRVFSDPLYHKCNASVQKMLDFYSDTINKAIENKHLYNNSNEQNIQEERVKMIKQLYLYKSDFVCIDG